ncbi:hypothetical protein AXL65_02475 [Salmonella enterica subsp. enterica]|nr:hypothetical protein [Salmonella enterica subsp. enterica]
MNAIERYKAFIARLEANGAELLDFACPCCKEPLKTQAAPEGATWDTFSSCPHCNDLFQKITTGKVVQVGRCPRVI